VPAASSWGTRERAEHGRADARGGSRPWIAVVAQARRRGDALGGRPCAPSASSQCKRPRHRARLAGPQRRGGQFGGGDERNAGGGTWVVPAAPRRLSVSDPARREPVPAAGRDPPRTRVRRAPRTPAATSAGSDRGQRDRGFRMEAAQRSKPAGSRYRRRSFDAATQHRIVALPQRVIPGGERGAASPPPAQAGDQPPCG